MADEKDPFEKINKGLSMYYTEMGDDTFYKDEEEKGKFLAYVIDQEFDADDIEDELNVEDPADLVYAEFDEDFPLPNALKEASEEEKLQEMIRILKSCFETGKPPSSTSSKLLEEMDLTIDEEIITNCKRMYSDQCTSMLGSDGLGDGTLMYFFQVGIKNNYSSFLLNMCDSFMRDRIGMAVNNAAEYTPDHWVNDNPSIKKWLSNNPQAKQLPSAIKSYAKRISPKMQLKALTRINDSLQDVTQRIIGVCELIGVIIKSENVLPPFQMDFVIAVKGVSGGSMGMNMDGGDDDDEDDSDDANDEDDDDEKDVNPELPKDVLENMVSAKLAFKHMKLTDKEQLKFDARTMLPIFQDYKKANKKNKNFPHKRRFCGLLDRRDKKETVTFYDAPGDDKKLNDIPTKRVAEWYFCGARDALFPVEAVSVKDSKKDNAKDEEKKEEKKWTYRGASCGYQGTLVTLSFHVEQADEVKCYFYWNGQVFRFYPSDIYDVLPLIFDMKSEANQKYAESKEIRADAKKIKVIKDSKFEHLYKGMRKEKTKFPLIQ